MSDLLVVLLFGIMQGSIYTAVALGLVLIFGVTDIVNFAHGELVTFGAFGIILMAPEIGYLPALVLTLVGVGVIAGIMYLGAFQFTIGNHLQGLVLSLGLLLIIQNTMIREYTTIPRRGPSFSGFIDLPGGDARIATVRIVVLALLLAAAAVFYFALKRSWIGVALRACGSDEFAASTIGLSARRVGLYAFVVSGILAAAAGVAIAALFPVTPLTGTGFLLKGFVVVIVGGLGSVTGALVAGVALGVLESMGGRYIDPALTNVYGFVFMIAVLLIAPQGLFNRSVRRA